VDQVNRLIAQYTETPTLGFLGDARVNVLQLNLALDRYFQSAGDAVAGL
jgi:K+-transporting ATPase ATPase C chain